MYSLVPSSALSARSENAESLPVARIDDRGKSGHRGNRERRDQSSGRLYSLWVAFPHWSRAVFKNHWQVLSQRVGLDDPCLCRIAICRRSDSTSFGFMPSWVTYRACAIVVRNSEYFTVFVHAPCSSRVSGRPPLYLPVEYVSVNAS